MLFNNELDISEKIKTVENKIKQLTSAIHRALTLELERINKELGIAGYTLIHHKEENKFIVSKQGNSAQFVINLEKYIHAWLFDIEVVNAFHIYSGGENNYEVKIPLVEIHKLHRNFTNEIDNLLDKFIIFVESGVLGN